MQITDAGRTYLLASFATVLLFAVTPWTIADASAQSLPIGAWIGAGGTGTTLTDSSGNNRHGTISGGTWVTGRVGQALNFTGSGFADLGDLDMPGSFTVLAWMQTRSLYAGTCGSLVMKARDYGLEICGGQLFARIGSASVWSAQVTKALTSADLNTWKHVAMSYDGTTLRLYFGGALVGSANGAHTSSNDPLLFGRWNPAKEYWNGLIDEVRIYNRRLSNSQVQADMNSTGSPTSNAAPTVSLTTPVGGATFTAPATIAMAATAADSDGSVTKVDFYNGSTLLGTDTTSPYAYSWTGVAAGSYSLKAIATDNAGATTSSSTAAITVSSAANAAPNVSITSPAAGASFTAPATIVVTATATDSDGTIAKVDFYNGSALLGSDTTSPYSYSWSNVGAGSYGLRAIATDNGGATRTSGTVTVTVATAVSGLVGSWIGAGGTGTTLTDSSGNNRHGTISGAAWVAGRVGQALNFTGSAFADLGDLDMPGSFTVLTWMQTRSLYSGTCGALVMKARDYGLEVCGSQLYARVGASGGWSAQATKALTSADLNAWRHVAMTYDGTTLRLYVGGVLAGSATGAHTSNNDPMLFGRWNPAEEYWNGLIDEVKIYSRALSQAEVQTDMGGTPPANVAPAVSLTTPVGGATFTAPATIAIAATATDSDGSVTKVDFYNGTTLLGTDATSPYTYSWTGVVPGSYGVKAVATDNAGATTTSATVNITVGGAPNLAPTVSMTSPTTGASFVVGATVTFTANASDSDGTIQKVEFYLGPLLLATDTTSPYSTTWPAILGSFSVSAVATDNLGARTVSAWRDFVVTASALMSTAIFKPASPADGVDYYVLEVFRAGADPNTAAPVAVQNLGLPAVVGGECSADVRATITGLASGNYVATVVAVSEGTEFRSNTFSFSR